MIICLILFNDRIFDDTEMLPVEYNANKCMTSGI